MTYGDMGLEEIILQACRRDTRFDNQCDESHDVYLADVLELTGRPDFYLSRLIEDEQTIRGRRSLAQWAELLCEMTKRGSLLALQHLESSWKRDIDLRRCDLPAAYIEAGPVSVAEEVFDYACLQWQSLKRAPDGTYGIIRESEDRIGKEAQIALEKRLVDKYPHASRVLDLPDRDRARIPDVTESLSPEQRVLRGRAVFSKVSDEECSALAKLLEGPLEPKQARAVLKSFRRNKFPGSLDVLFKWTEHEDPYVSHAAWRALEEIRHPRVRALAFSKREVDFLENNFEIGDEVWIEGLVLSIENPSLLHHQNFAIRKLVEKHPTLEWVPTLRWIFDRMWCQICRKLLAELLHARQALDIEEVRDLQFDAYSHNRSWAKEILEGKSQATD